MRTVRAFVRLSRLKFLLGGFAGFALGASVAAYEGARISLQLYLAGQTMVTAFHLMTHYANDYFDRASDRRGASTEFSGGSGVLVAGDLAPRVALGAALACASIGLLVALGFARAGIPAAAVVGAAIGILAWVYSAPPLRLAARGWGEVDTALVVGILVPLTGFAAFTGTVDRLALEMTAAPACAMFAMMIAVEWPDRAADAAGNKRNLVVRYGARAGARLATVAAFLIVPALLVALRFGAPMTTAIFSLLLIPPIAGFISCVNTPATHAAKVAARGVTVFLLTVIYELLGYVTSVR